MTFVTNSFAVGLATLAVLWGGLAFVPAAHAQDVKSFEVRIAYTKSDPAEVTYASLKGQAFDACRREGRAIDLSNLAVRTRWVQKCAAEVTGKAVAAIGGASLMALHESASSMQVAGR